MQIPLKALSHFSHLHNIWNNKEITPIDAIVEIGYVISEALFELVKKLNTKEAVQDENIQI